jgi:hypothetical protein
MTLLMFSYNFRQWKHQTEWNIDGIGRQCKTITIYEYDTKSKDYAQGTAPCGTGFHFIHSFILLFFK